MRTGRPAGRADVADHVAALHRVAGLHVIRAQMAVTRGQPERVLEDDQVAVVARITRGLHHAVSRRVDGLAFFSGDVDSRVVRGFAREWIAAPPEEAREAAVRRPDGRRRIGELYAAVDVAP